jgi:hypothetical protein
VTKQELAEIGARAQNATEGPWFTNEDGGLYHCAGHLIGAGPDGEDAGFIHPDDAVFAAAARQDIPALIAEVGRLRGFVTELANAVPYGDAMFQAYQKHVVRLLDANGIGHVWNQTRRLPPNGQTR